MVPVELQLMVPADVQPFLFLDCLSSYLLQWFPLWIQASKNLISLQGVWSKLLYLVYSRSTTQANQRFYSSQFFFSFDVFTLLYLFIWFLYFWLGWVFSATCGLSLVVGSRNYSSCSAQVSHCSGFSYCRSQALGTWDLWLLALLRVSTDVVHRLSYSVVCGSSWTRNCIVPCNGRQIPIHCTTWSLPQNIL